MTLPNLPTDNLYKFLALAGVACVLAANWLTSDAQFRRQELLTKERQATEDRLLDSIWQTVDRVMKEHDTKDERMKSLKNIEPMMDARAGMERTKLQERQQEINDEADTQVFMLGLLEVVGVVCAPLGFVLWWFRVQQYQDRILRAESDKAKGVGPPELPKDDREVARRR